MNSGPGQSMSGSGVAEHEKYIHDHHAKSQKDVRGGSDNGALLVYFDIATETWKHDFRAKKLRCFGVLARIFSLVTSRAERNENTKLRIRTGEIRNYSSCTPNPNAVSACSVLHFALLRCN